MNQIDQHIKQAELIVKFLKNELSDQEKAALDQWLEESEQHRILFAELTNSDAIKAELMVLEQFPANADWNQLASRTIGAAPTTKVSILKGLQQRWYYAAAILCIVFVSTFILLHKQMRNPEQMNAQSIEKAKLISPGSNKAIITIADGSVIAINDSTNGLVSKQGNVDLVIQNGELSYQTVGKNQKIAFNTISTPNGGQYRLVLADGTKVWLNAASSLKYPTVFNGQDRVVELQGEGYFEVAHQNEHPFKVTLRGNAEVEDIGTSFNINAYNNESIIKTTLLEGSVKVSSSTKSLILHPKQQASITASGQVEREISADTEEALAWKNGRFIFKSATLEHIMKQMERWYDIDVVFKSKIKEEKFTAIISRSGNLSDVLKMMSDAGVTFSLDGKTVVIY